MKWLFISAAAAFLALVGGAGQQTPTPDKPKSSHLPEGYTIPEQAAQHPNPVKPTETSIAAGAKFYSSQCAMCHGKNGDGKGDLAVELGLNILDYRKPESLAPYTDGELFYILTNGMGKMPGEGDRTPEPKRWSVINYLRSLSKGKQGAKPAPRP